MDLEYNLNKKLYCIFFLYSIENVYFILVMKNNLIYVQTYIFKLYTVKNQSIHIQLNIYCFQKLFDYVYFCQGVSKIIKGTVKKVTNIHFKAT